MRAWKLLVAAALPSTLIVPLLVVGTSDATSRVSNPFLGAYRYVNPEWTANVVAEADQVGGELGEAMREVSTLDTAVWLDSIGDIEGVEGRGLRDHLDEALRQAAGRTAVVPLVIANAPERDCHRSPGTSELRATEIDRYRSEFIDPIVDIVADDAYQTLHIAVIIEPDTLSEMWPGLFPTIQCAEVAQTGAQRLAVQYAIDAFYWHTDAFLYLDASSSDRSGWDDPMAALVQVLADTVQKTQAGQSAITGFAVNVAGYTPLDEPYLDMSDTVQGASIRQSKWVDWSRYLDELPYTRDLRTKLIAAGFREDIGMLVDTGRNGWGGPDRPTGPSTSTQLNVYVDESRIDRRTDKGEWCNPIGAGLGTRPTAAPEPGIHAYLWIKPPGESDGSDLLVTGGSPTTYVSDCDSIRGGGACGSCVPPDSHPDSPPAGRWFSTAFRELVANAHPPFDGTSTSTSSSTSTTTTTSSSSTTSTTSSTSSSSTTTSTRTTLSTVSTEGPRCTAAYHQLAQWSGGFVGQVRVTAVGGPLRGWRVVLEFPSGETISSYWSAAHASANPPTFDNAPWNGALPTGASTEFGFVGAGQGGTPKATCIAR